ncbi:MAG TPA: HAMP domain-containing sensor histidine kinase [Trichormus sp.]|jgi:signal transduction histidine kinase
MFSNVRWRIALWFVGLSTAAYLIPTALALIIFYASLTSSLDRELDGFIASFGHAINVVEGKPVLRDWTRIVETSPAHSLVTYQLFDRDAHLVEAHFPPGIPTLFKDEREVSSNGITMRTRMTELKEGKTVVGYLQVQLPTKARDDAVKELAIITAMIAPVVLLGLGWSSYLVSEKATVQIRRTLTMLRRFIADASHELYTPLSIAQAANESLARLVQPSGIGASEFEISENALERMEGMLEDLLLLSTMEAPEASDSTPAEAVELQELLQNVVDEFRPKFEQKNVTLSITGEGTAKLRGDRATLHRMLANIIENAYRYTNAPGSVSISLSRDTHHARITISDTGIGIPKESLPNIFDRFYRVDASRSRASGGAGLGLAIALAIAQAHGGTIEAESELGSGSQFRITLPTQNPV